MPEVNVQAEYTLFGYTQVDIPEGKEIKDVFIKWDTVHIVFTDETKQTFENVNFSYEDGDTKRPDHISIYDEDYEEQLYDAFG